MTILCSGLTFHVALCGCSLFVSVDETLEGDEWLRGTKVDTAVDDEHSSGPPPQDGAAATSGIFPVGYVKQVRNPHVVLHQFDKQEDDDLQLNVKAVSCRCCVIVVVVVEHRKHDSPLCCRLLTWLNAKANG